MFAVFHNHHQRPCSQNNTCSATPSQPAICQPSVGLRNLKPTCLYISGVWGMQLGGGRVFLVLFFQLDQRRGLKKKYKRKRRQLVGGRTGEEAEKKRIGGKELWGGEGKGQGQSSTCNCQSPSWPLGLRTLSHQPIPPRSCLA